MLLSASESSPSSANNAIPLKRFTDRTVRIARADLDKASEGRTTGINTPAPQLTDDLSTQIFLKERGSDVLSHDQANRHQ